MNSGPPMPGGWQPQQPPYPPMYGYPPMSGYPRRLRNGFGVAAISLGSVATASLVLIYVLGRVGDSPGPDALNALLGITSFVCCVLAIIFGAVGRHHANRGRATNGGLAIAGLLLGVLPIALMLIGFVIMIVVMSS